MTTDTYPKVATAHGRDRRRRRSPSTASPRAPGMIAPDMATMLSFVVTDRRSAAPCCRHCCRRRRHDVQLRSPSTATPRPATRCCCLPPARREAGARDHRADGPAARRSSARRSNACCSISRCRWCATARARASWSRSTVTGAESDDARPSASRCRSPIRRWSRRRSPARTPIGAASSWRSARPASRPTATAGDLVRRHPRRRQGRTRPGYSEAATSAYMKQRGDRDHASRSASAAARRRSGPATSPRSMSTINGDYRS